MIRFLTGFLLVCVLAAGGVGAYAVGESLKPIRIVANFGGAIDEFLEQQGAWRATHRKIMVDGLCLSACTLLVTMPEQVCITSRATFGFHSAWTEGPMGMGAVFTREGTRMVWHLYPEKLRDLLRDKYEWDGDGDEDHPDLIYPTHEELLQFLPAC